MVFLCLKDYFSLKVPTKFRILITFAARSVIRISMKPLKDVEETAAKICGWIKANYQEMAEEDGLENACWPGYSAIGTKELDGRIVPNCVPDK